MTPNLEGVWLVGLESLSLRTFPVMIYSKMVKRQWSVNLLVLTVGNLVVWITRARQGSTVPGVLRTLT